MSFTSFYIEKLRISNFLSFFGIQEVRIQRLTAIIFHYSEGKRDLLRALEFVFGANVKELQVESPKQLVHKVLWKEFENDNGVPCFVEVSLESLSNKEWIKFYRGVTSSGLEHKIDDTLVSKSYYEEKLAGLDLYINSKNLVFGKNLFYEVIWGYQEGLEKIVTKILRTISSLDEWRKTKDKLKYLQETKKILDYKNFKKMKNSHGTIEKFVNVFNGIAMKRQYLHDSLNLEEILDEDSLPSGLSHIKSETLEENVSEVLFEEVNTLEDKRDSLLDDYRRLEKKEKLLHSELYFNEVKISSKPANTTILQERITKLKGKLREEEKWLSLLWAKMEENDNELKELHCKISVDMAQFYDMQQSFYLNNKITMYGRFIDYFESNNFVHTLRKILGEDIIYGNLCDDVETAVFYLDLLKKMMYKRRENFLIFKNYSPKLKDLLLASGEEGIKLKSIQDLQILLCKLKQYELISSVPVIIEKGFNFQLKEGNNYNEDIIYPEDGIFLKSDGLIIYSPNNKINMETEKSLLERVNSLLIEQELKYEEHRNLFFIKFETLQNMTDLENDIFYLKYELKKKGLNRVAGTSKEDISKVFNPFVDLSEEDNQLMEDMQGQIEESEDDKEISTVESLITSISVELDETENEKIRMKKELSAMENKLRHLDFTSSGVPFQPIPKFSFFNPPKMTSYFYYKKQLEDLKLLLPKKEKDEFEDWKDWRKEVIESLIQDMGTIDDSLKTLKAALEKLTASRKKVLSPLLEHCSLHLTQTLNLMMDTSLPFLELTMNESEDCLQLLTSASESLVKLIDISNLNTFLKFIAALSLFLEIAVYDKIPIIFLDDMEEFLPLHKDNFEAVISENSLNRVAPFEGTAYFQIIMRMIQFFELLIKKNSSGSKIRKNGNHTGRAGKYITTSSGYGKIVSFSEDTNRPAQIIYFTKGDFVHFTKHQLWIRSKFLPDEYTNSECDMHSFLQEICFNSD